MAQELFQIDEQTAVQCNPEGRFHGWLFRKHPDGQWVSVRKLNLVENPFGAFAALAPKQPTPGTQARYDRESADWLELNGLKQPPAT